MYAKIARVYFKNPQHTRTALQCRSVFPCTRCSRASPHSRPHQIRSGPPNGLTGSRVDSTKLNPPAARPATEAGIEHPAHARHIHITFTVSHRHRAHPLASCLAGGPSSAVTLGSVHMILKVDTTQQRNTAQPNSTLLQLERVQQGC